MFTYWCLLFTFYSSWIAFDLTSIGLTFLWIIFISHRSHKPWMALNSLLCTDVPLRNYTLTQLSSRREAARCFVPLWGVVSFNSTMPRAQSFIISYFGFSFPMRRRTVKFCSDVFGVTLRLSVINKINWFRWIDSSGWKEVSASLQRVKIGNRKISM